MKTAKTYSKPVLSRVELRPEQIVLSYCVDDECYTIIEGNPVPDLEMGSYSSSLDDLGSTADRLTQ